jgi:putative transposase
VKKSRFTEEQIVHALRQAEAGTPAVEICRKRGVSEQTFYRWKRQFTGMGVVELRRLLQVEEENRKLKQLVADLSLDRHMLQEPLRKNAPCAAGAPSRMKMAAAILRRPAGMRG